MDVSLEKLDAFVAAQPHAAFLQSSGWKKFQEALGRPVRVFTIGEPRIEATALCIELLAPGGFRYWFCPMGPIATSLSAARKLVQHIREQAQEKKIIFFRFEPSRGQFDVAALKRSRPIHPDHTLVLNLSDPVDKIFASFKPKTRYNIRLAEKHGVEIEVSDAASSVEVFFDLLQETGKRQGIRSHDKNYYQALLTILGPNHPTAHEQLSARLYLAKVKQRVIAANLMVFFGDTATYLHGGSAHGDRSVMAPHLLQWRTMQDAKAWGFRSYDFWGIAPPHEAETHAWAGITRFKLGFGGEAISRPGTFDLPLRPLSFHAYSLLRSLHYFSFYAKRRKKA